MKMQKVRWLGFGAAAMLMAALLSSQAVGTPAPQDPTETLPPPPELRPDRAGFANLARKAFDNRAAMDAGTMTFWEAERRGGIQVSGVRAIAVLPIRFKNSGDAPWPVANMQRQLFDGPWETGTLSDYYREASYWTFTVTGTVRPWQQVKHDDTHYEGRDYRPGPGEPLETCNGGCRNAKTRDLVVEAVKLNDSSVDFGQFDNDGADGTANSGDDDGIVDFVAVIHPERGGECAERDRNIRSFQWYLESGSNSAFVTDDKRPDGTSITVDSYSILPALACDGATMIQIGVFAHEFGHALTLPDLYDTNTKDGISSGIGNWGLMGTGSWGGNGRSPERPAHMSVWEKAYLGWVSPTEVSADLKDAHLHPIEEKREAYRIKVSDSVYYLVEYRRAVRFDDRLPGSGLLVWRVDETVLNREWEKNRVNGDETAKGLALVEADGRSDLDDEDRNRGDFGDMFRGSAARLLFDSSTQPAATSAAICDIGEAGDIHNLRIVVSRIRCEEPPPRRR